MVDPSHVESGGVALLDHVEVRPTLQGSHVGQRAHGVEHLDQLRREKARIVASRSKRPSVRATKMTDGIAASAATTSAWPPASRMPNPSALCRSWPECRTTAPTRTTLASSSRTTRRRAPAAERPTIAARST